MPLSALPPFLVILLKAREGLFSCEHIPEQPCPPPKTGLGSRPALSAAHWGSLAAALVPVPGLRGRGSSLSSLCKAAWGSSRPHLPTSCFPSVAPCSPVAGGGGAGCHAACTPPPCPPPKAHLPWSRARKEGWQLWDEVSGACFPLKGAPDGLGRRRPCGICWMCTLPL